MSDVEKSSLSPNSVDSDVATCDSKSDLLARIFSTGASSPQLDGTGEPCPAPLMWQEVRDHYLRDSIPWEIVRGSHRLVGRTLGEGPPLYFLNHFVGTAELYSLLIWLLRDRYRCVVFDAVTSDAKAARHDKPTMADFANDFAVVADRYGDRQIRLYGAGFGAAVALQALCDHSQLIDRLVLQHGFARRKLTLFERLLASVCLRSGKNLDQLPQRRRFQAVNHKPWFPPFDSSRFDFLIQSTGTLPLRDLARRAMAIHSFDLTSKLDAISLPVMLLRTEGEGRVAAADQDLLEKQIRNVRVEWMHSAGQHPYLTHPHRVVKILDSFLQP